MPAKSGNRLREKFLVQSAERLNRAFETKRILEAIRDLSTDALDASACSVLLLNEKLNRWEYHLVWNELVEPHNLQYLEIDQGLAGSVAMHCEASIVTDPAGDDRLAHLSGMPAIADLESILAVPLIRGSDVIGVVEVINSRRPEGFSADDQELLEALGNQASIALANARLYSMVRLEKRENELLYRLGLELARTLRLEEILPLLVGLLSEMIEFDAVGIYLLNKDNETLEWFYGHGYPDGAEEKVRLKVGQGAVGWVASHQSSLIIPDVDHDERYHCARSQTASEMIVPLITENELVGVFILESDTRDAFSDRALRLLSTFGNQSAIAIQRIWYYGEAIEKRRLEEEIRIARRIQRRLLPSEHPDYPGLDVAAFNHPSQQVSGDAYDFIDISYQQVGIMIGDVAGKGISAGILMASFRASLRAEIRNNYAIKTILSRVNRLMWESSEDTAFITAVYGVLDLDSGRLTFCNAGHNPVLLVRRTGSVEYLEEGGTVLGSFPNAVYVESFVDLQQGDMLVFYTDGITEATAPSGEMFGLDRLEAILSDRDARGNSAGICQRILNAVHTFCQGHHVEDDLTAIVLQMVDAPKSAIGIPNTT